MKSLTDFIKEYWFQLIIATVILYSSSYALNNFEKEKEKITEGLNAISWLITAPICEVRGFCLYIEEDAEVGTFIDSVVFSEFINQTYSYVNTSAGKFAIMGDLKGAKYNNKSIVTLHVKKGSLNNVLCIDRDSCYLVPYNENKH